MRTPLQMSRHRHQVFAGQVVAAAAQNVGEQYRIGISHERECVIDVALWIVFSQE